MTCSSVARHQSTFDVVPSYQTTCGNIAYQNHRFASVPHCYGRQKTVATRMLQALNFQWFITRGLFLSKLSEGAFHYSFSIEPLLQFYSFQVELQEYQHLTFIIAISSQMFGCDDVGFSFVLQLCAGVLW